MDCVDHASHLLDCLVRSIGTFGRYTRNCFMHGLDHLNHWPSDVALGKAVWLVFFGDRLSGCLMDLNLAYDAFLVRAVRSESKSSIDAMAHKLNYFNYL